MAIVKNFDLSHLYKDAETYRKDMQSIELLTKEIETLYAEVKEGWSKPTPDLNEKMDTYLGLVRQRTALQQSVAEAEKNLEQGIDMLTTLEETVLPNGNSVRVVKRDDFLHAQVYVIDPDNRVVDTVTLEMASNPKDVEKVQGIINDLQAYMVEQASAADYTVDHPIYEEIKALEVSDEKLDKFGKFKEMMSNLNTKMASYAGRAREMYKVVAEYTKAQYNNLKLSVNEWGQYAVGEYRSVRKSFSSVDDFTKELKDTQKSLANLTKELNEVEDKLHDAKAKEARLIGTNKFAAVFMPNKEKKLDEVRENIANLSRQRHDLVEKKQQLKSYAQYARAVFSKTLVRDTLEIRNKTVGQHSIQIQTDNETVQVILSSKGKVYEHFVVALDDKRPLEEQIAELEKFNKVINSMSPRSVDDRHAEQNVDPELNQFLESQKSDQLTKIKTIMSEMEQTDNVDVEHVQAKTKELIDLIRDYSSYTNHACDIYIDADGTLNLDISDQHQTKLVESMSIKVEPELGKEIMEIAHKISDVNDVVYAQDQSKEFELTTQVYLAQYEQMASEYVANGDMEALQKLNQTLVDRMLVVNQMPVGNSMVFVAPHGEGFKMRIVDEYGRPEVIVCPIGLNGKLELRSLETYVARVASKDNENKRDADRDHEQPSTTSAGTSQSSNIPQEQEMRNKENVPGNIYDAIEELDQERQTGAGKSKEIESKSIER